MVVYVVSVGWGLCVFGMRCVMGVWRGVYMGCAHVLGGGGVLWCQWCDVHVCGVHACV